MAVFPHLSAEDLAGYLVYFDLGQCLSFGGITSGVENTNYRIDTEGGRYVLTLFEKRSDPARLPFIFSFMRRLKDHGLPVPSVIADKNGSDTRTLKDKTALLVSWLDGTSILKPDPEHCAAMGRMLAQMHTVGTDFDNAPENAAGYDLWQSLIAACGNRGETLSTGLTTELAAALADARQLQQCDIPQGAVHADAFPDNVFFSTGPSNEKREKSICGIFDFYFSCREKLAYDLMLTLNAWCFRDCGRAIDKTAAAAFLYGYLSVRNLSRAEKETLPLCGLAAALRIVSTRLYDHLHPTPGATVTPKNPMEHVHILRYHRDLLKTGRFYDWWPQ